MLIQLIKCLFLFVIFQNLNWAGTLPKEVFFKEMSGRMKDLLKHSNEAQHFIGEDLSGAFETISEASIKWTDSLSPVPLLFEEEGRFLIYISKHYSFMASSEEQVKLVLELLLHVQRQLEVSLMPLPELRINLFARKFSPELLGEENDCSFSPYPITIPLNPSQREKFHRELLSLMKARGFAYSSKRGAKVVWLESTSTTDAGCGGENRNIQILKAHVMDITSKRHLELGSERSESCGFKPVKIDRALKNLMRKIEDNLPKCKNAFWF